MKNFFKGKLGTVVILVFTLILAGVAVFTALRLYELRSQPVSPNVPSSIPKAGGLACALTFTISTSTGSPTPTPTGSGTPTPTPTGNQTPTATPTVTPTGVPNSCNGTCGSNTNCGTGLYCNTSVGFCRNPSCPDQADCNCPGSTTTPTPTATAHVTAPTPTPTAPALPSSGTDWPTVVGAGIGIFVVAGSLLLAL